MKQLLDDLRDYDGKAVTILEEIAARHGAGASYAADLVALAGYDIDAVSDGATWLLKAYLEEGGRLDAAATRRLLDSLDRITAWQAQLHLCQMTEFLDVPADQAAAVAAWLTPMLHHKRPFLRAWSMNALQHGAAQHPSFAAEAEAALKAAEADKAASVRARARALRSSPASSRSRA